MERDLRVTGPGPVAQVWERYAVPARWAQWAPHIRRVEIRDGSPADRIAPGVTGRVHGPGGVAAAFVVTAVDERARSWAWDVTLGLLRMHLRHGVEEHPRGCATWLAIRGPAPAVVAYLPVARLALGRLVR